MNILLVSTLVSAVISGTAVWKIQSGRIDNLKLEYANERIAQQWESRKAIVRASDALIAAQNAAAARTAVISRTADANATELERLHNLSNSAMRASSATSASCSAAISTYDNIFTECTARLVKMAEIADRAISDSQALIGK